MIDNHLLDTEEQLVGKMTVSFKREIGRYIRDHHACRRPPLKKITMEIRDLLVDSAGNAYKGCTPDSVTVEEDAIIVDVRKAINIETQINLVTVTLLICLSTKTNKTLITRHLP